MHPRRPIRPYSEKHKRRPLRPEKLYATSRRWHDYLLANRPQWLEHAFNVLGHEHNDFDLEIEIPHPAAGRRLGRLRLAPCPLTIYMNYAEEVTVDWWRWHGHFSDDWGYDTELEAFVDAVRYVDKLLSERLIVVVEYQGEREGSIGCRDTESIEAVIADPDHRRHGTTSLLIRSWNATHDRRVKLR